MNKQSRMSEKDQIMSARNVAFADLREQLFQVGLKYYLMLDKIVISTLDDIPRAKSLFDAFMAVEATSTEPPIIVRLQPNGKYEVEELTEAEAEDARQYILNKRAVDRAFGGKS